MEATFINKKNKILYNFLIIVPALRSLFKAQDGSVPVRAYRTIGSILIFTCLTTLHGQQEQKAVLKSINLSKAEIMAIGNKIWLNESKMSVEKLAWWNKNEHFASLGIGHFIWYPCNEEVLCTQTFPALLVFLEQHGKKIPAWLNNKSNRCCPWKTREDFFKDFQSKRMNELRTLLASTVDLQTQFIIQRTSKALELILQSTPVNEHAHIKKQFKRVASSATGLYAIIDYINFKGEGVNPGERHNGKGWGLLQILQSMRGNELNMKAVAEFAQCAKKVLTQRVLNAPKNSHESQFLPGWKKRIDSYMHELKIT